MPTAYLKQPLTADRMAVLRAGISAYPGRKLANEPRCDFCGDDKPVVTYAASRMASGEPRRCWRWCACTRCEKLVDANDWNGIREVIADWCCQQMPNVPKELAKRASAHSFAEFTAFAIKAE